MRVWLAYIFKLGACFLKEIGHYGCFGLLYISLHSITANVNLPFHPIFGNCFGFFAEESGFFSPTFTRKPSFLCAQRLPSCQKIFWQEGDPQNIRRPKANTLALIFLAVYFENTLQEPQMKSDIAHFICVKWPTHITSEFSVSDAFMKS